MTDDVKQTAGNVNPIYKDELDVLKVIEGLEKKYGKKLLTEEQRGRIAGDWDQSSVKTSTIIDGKLLKQSYKVVRGLMLGLDDRRSEFYSNEAWESYDEEARDRAREDMFLKVYGVTSEQMGFDIYLGLGGKNG